MAFPPLTTILKKILKQPTAPFHEYFVRAELEAMLKEVPHVKTKVDKYGNLLATYKHGKKKSAPTWVLAAHMDHPAFVQKPDSKGEYEFLGGVSQPVLDDGIKRKLRKTVKGAPIAVWNFPVEITKERISATACDDLINCATIVATFMEMASLNMETTMHAVFTRAEEVGWLGAWHLGENWPFDKDAVFLSLETSRPVNGALFGAGPVIRVGDRLSIFDSEAVAVLMRTAADQGIRVQRCLLDAGACEATALQALGMRSAGISIPLGNYHNTSDDKTLAPEYVMMEDVKALIRLLTALGVVRMTAPTARSIKERVEIRMEDYKAHYKAGTKHFVKR
jgi:putative aminopeptidase FrvX